jgi:hypothetical protein
MDNLSIVDLVQTIALVFAVAMIFVARRGLNGFAIGFMSMGVLLILRRVNSATEIIGDEGMDMITSMVVVVYCWQAWKVWKDRHDHAEWLHWREQWAAELKLIREWQERKADQTQREQELERQRSESGEQLSSWDHQWPLAVHTRNVTRARNKK